MKIDGTPLLPVYPDTGLHKALVLSDYLFLIALAVAVTVAVDPFELDLEGRPLTRHLSLLLASLASALSLAGTRIFPAPERRPQSLSALAPLLILALFLAGGGFYARFRLGEQNSFLIAGLYIALAPMSAAILLRCRDPRSFLRYYFSLLIAASIVVFVGLAANYGVRQIYHELEYLFPALAVLAAFGASSRRMKWTGIAFFLVLAFLFKKNTGYLAGLIVLAYLAIFYATPRLKNTEPMRKVLYALVAIVAMALAATLAAYLLAHRARYLPSGNPDFRLVTYALAWQRFLDSPIYGNLFTGPYAHKFTAFDTGVSFNILPTHSDSLDMLANGGVIAAALLAGGLIRVARLAWSGALNEASAAHPLVPYAHALACMSLAGVLTYTFNPILLQPGKAALLWANLGLLVAISLIVRKDTNIGKAPRTP